MASINVKTDCVDGDIGCLVTYFSKFTNIDYLFTGNSN